MKACATIAKGPAINWCWSWGTRGEQKHAAEDRRRGNNRGKRTETSKDPHTEKQIWALRTKCPLHKWQIKMTHWLRCHKSLGVGWVSERTENDQKWKRKIKGEGWGLSSHSRITTLSPGWADSYMLTTRAGGHMYKDECVKMKGIQKVQTLILCFVSVFASFYYVCPPHWYPHCDTVAE